jgi:hypothetical protein
MVAALLAVVLLHLTENLSFSLFFFSCPSLCHTRLFVSRHVLRNVTSKLPLQIANPPTIFPYFVNVSLVKDTDVSRKQINPPAHAHKTAALSQSAKVTEAFPIACSLHFSCVFSSPFLSQHPTSSLNYGFLVVT